jgi:hypothetical protein
VTAATLQRPGRSLISQLLAVVSVAVPASRKFLAACVPAVREHLATFAAFAAVDYGAFSAWHHGGWIVLGVTLLLADFKVRG